MEASSRAWWCCSTICSRDWAQEAVKAVARAQVRIRASDFIGRSFRGVTARGDTIGPDDVFLSAGGGGGLRVRCHLPGWWRIFLQRLSLSNGRAEIFSGRWTG